MKYEMIFGDQSLFDGAPEDAEYAGWFCQEVRWYMILNGKILFSDGGTWCTSDNPYLSADIVAMRRIIKTPVWTWEDKKAGRLPEVGSTFTYKNETLTCHFIDCDGEIWAHDINDRIVTPWLKDCQPIETPAETPAEKAQRLKSEWCAKAAKQLKNLEYTSTLTSIYDAMLSGELKAPEVE